MRTCKTYPEKVVPYFSTLNIFSSPPVSSNFGITMLFYCVEEKSEF